MDGQDQVWGKAGSQADRAEIERQLQMLLAGCGDWRGVVLSLASRLVMMRALRDQAALDEEAGLRLSLDQSMSCSKHRRIANAHTRERAQPRSLEHAHARVITRTHAHARACTHIHARALALARTHGRARAKARACAFTLAATSRASSLPF
eukprot:5052173-Pleurochrysis_carterae.AAC.1